LPNLHRSGRGDGRFLRREEIDGKTTGRPVAAAISHQNLVKTGLRALVKEQRALSGNAGVPHRTIWFLHKHGCGARPRGDSHWLTRLQAGRSVEGPPRAEPVRNVSH